MLRLQWFPEIRRHCPIVPVILVGTMVDARDTESPTGAKGDMPRHISRAEGQALADELGAVKYMECSAKCSQLGLKAVFDEAMKVAVCPPPTIDLKSKRPCVVT